MQYGFECLTLYCLEFKPKTNTEMSAVNAVKKISRTENLLTGVNVQLLDQSAKLSILLTNGKPVNWRQCSVIG